MKYLTYILVLILVLLATGFSILNAQHVELHYYLGTISLPLSWLLLCALIIGVVLGAGIFLPRVIYTSLNNRKLRQTIQNYEIEIRNLRTFPIRDEQ